MTTKETRKYHCESEVTLCFWFAESNAARLLQAGAIDPIVAMKRCDRDGIQRMAEKTLACLVKFNGKNTSSNMVKDWVKVVLGCPTSQADHADFRS